MATSKRKSVKKGSVAAQEPTATNSKPSVSSEPAQSELLVAQEEPVAQQAASQTAPKPNKKAKVSAKTPVVEPQTAAPSSQAEVQTPAVEAKLESNLAKQPPRALNSPIRVFQIYFEAWQRELLDPAFYPLDNSRGNPDLMEFGVFEQLARNQATQGAQLWGALSWRFGEKTGMSGGEFVKQIVEHPGYDVYFCNPYPFNEALYHNMWMQGEVSHPQFASLANAFYVAAGLDPKEIREVEPSTNFTAANYFVASPKFWEKFIPFIKRVLVTADKRLPPAVRDLLHSKVADDKGLHPGSSYVPFIVERLFVAFMRTDGKGLKAFKVTLPERERELNVHLKLLREMKDVAHRTKSAWLAACWVNYRNLYFSQTNGKEWCEKHLRSITPTEVLFGS